MASKKKNKNEIRYALNDDDYSAFGRYRILYTAGGRKLVNHQRLTYFISGVMIALLFTPCDSGVARRKSFFGNTIFHSPFSSVLRMFQSAIVNAPPMANRQRLIYMGARTSHSESAPAMVGKTVMIRSMIA